MSTDKKADFSDVHGAVDSTADAVKKADFSDVSSKVESTGELLGGESYTIKAGDSLSKIAKAQYGEASAWKQIFEANKDVIDDPDRIFPGQVIKLPGKNGAPDTPAT